MKRFTPQTIATQLAALIVVSVIAANVAGALMLFLSESARGRHPAENIGRLAGFIELLDRASPDERTELLRAIAMSHPEFAVAPSSVGLQGIPEIRRRSHLTDVLGEDFSVNIAERESPGLGRSFFIRLRDGAIVTAREPVPADRPWFGPPLLSWLIVGFCLLGVALWSGFRITRPLKVITQAAEEFTLHSQPKYFVAGGPLEIRALAAALNRMQDRIGELVAEKTNALAAVSHDLRTPITRMRLRAEFMMDGSDRDRMIHDLDVMDRLTASALSYLRGMRETGCRERIDLASLIHSVADRFTDSGKSISVEINALPIASIHALDLERALENLIENAFKYATPPIVRLFEEAGKAVIDVEDRGPGIPSAKHQQMMRPFTRGDEARSADSPNGFGMGLAIAREALERQGARLYLRNVYPHGLLARIELHPIV